MRIFAQIRLFRASIIFKKFECDLFLKIHISKVTIVFQVKTGTTILQEGEGGGVYPYTI